mmetsp:Transcript_14079/g.56648  ORF Transcript_14079/g.56648 Transcript_14079/m.56648 type:complete len:305 (-) Transcript_14079:1294-2208(-)
MDEMVDMDVDDNCKVVIRAATRSSKEDVDRSSELGQMCVVAGDQIHVEPGFVRGHGTLAESGLLIATVGGVVDRVNKLVSVRPLVSRYTPEIGDVVIGRVVEVSQNRWKLDVDARQEAVLMLSAMNLPGGVQRRRTYEDELNMRSLIKEGDLISAEVQELKQDGGIALHTRSMKYGRLSEGQLVRVKSALIKRQKKRFQILPCEIHAIFGNNGYIWLSEEEPRKELEEPGKNTKTPKTSLAGRRRISRLRNSILILNEMSMTIHAQTIMDVYTTSEQAGLSEFEVLRQNVREQLLERVRNRRNH